MIKRLRMRLTRSRSILSFISFTQSGVSRSMSGKCLIAALSETPEQCKGSTSGSSQVQQVSSDTAPSLLLLLLPSYLLHVFLLLNVSFSLLL
jgi:hypothetical protein